MGKRHGFRINPPVHQEAQETVGVRVAVEPHAWAYAADRAVAANERPELLARELLGLIDTDKRDLRALPLDTVIFVLHVRKLDPDVVRWERPGDRRSVRRPARSGINLHRRVPELTLGHDLAVFTAEDDRAETWHSGGKTWSGENELERIHFEGERLAAALRPAGNGYVGGGRKIPALRTVLRPKYGPRVEVRRHGRPFGDRHRYHLPRQDHRGHRRAA